MIKICIVFIMVIKIKKDNKQILHGIFLMRFHSCLPSGFGLILRFIARVKFCGFSYSVFIYLQLHAVFSSIKTQFTFYRKLKIQNQPGILKNGTLIFAVQKY